MNSIEKTPLCLLFEKYLSDKCPTIFHSYSPAYYEILKNYSNSFKNILEIGIGTNEIMESVGNINKIQNEKNIKYKPGASLRAWRDFFINSNVYGADINQQVLFEEERIKCFFVDQSNASSLIDLYKKINSNLDLIIDDGSHVVDHMVLSVKILFPLLKKESLYIIEDIKKKDIDIFLNLNLENCKVIYLHEGISEWDSFICFEKI